MDLYRRIALIRTEADADDVLDELIDRFGEPPGSVTALIQVALLRGEAGEAGITDISQKNGLLRFEILDFSMARISALCDRKEMKNRVKVEAGKTPCLSFRLHPGDRVLDMARGFVAAWKDTEERTTQT